MSQKTIGIVGGGQLGRMLTLAALPLGFKVIVVDAGENCPAAQAGAEQIKGGLRDKKALLELAKRADYITIEIEHLDADILQTAVNQGATINPAPSTIKLIQDKYEQKIFLEEKELPVAPFAKIINFEQSMQLLEQYNGSMVLKTRHNAFDGRGNAVINSKKDLEAAYTRFNGAELYAEKMVNFVKELAVMVAKDMHGNIRPYPVVQTIHERNICIEVLIPAPVNDIILQKAISVATEAVSHLSGAGMFGVELFLLDSDEILINEIAPRVHNSGHITMNSAQTSQFEQHIRAISGLPLGSTKMVVPAATMINILGEQDADTDLQGIEQALQNENVHPHLYGKSPTKIDRKMGHINATGATIEEAQAAARTARNQITI